MQQEIGSRHLVRTRQELGAHRGADFDRAFIGQQVLSHDDMVDKLEVFRTHASGELRRQIDDELQILKTHLEQARLLAQQLR
jgi:predicted outer membrane protein